MMETVYNTLPEKIKREISEICKEDAHSLSSITLFKNIRNSKASNEQIAEIFEVKVSLVKTIKEAA